MTTNDQSLWRVIYTLTTLCVCIVCVCSIGMVKDFGTCKVFYVLSISRSLHGQNIQNYYALPVGCISPWSVSVIIIWKERSSYFTAVVLSVLGETLKCVWFQRHGWSEDGGKSTLGILERLWRSQEQR